MPRFCHVSLAMEEKQRESFATRLEFHDIRSNSKAEIDWPRDVV